MVPSLSSRMLVDLMVPWPVGYMPGRAVLPVDACASPRAAPSSSLTLVVQSNGLKQLTDHNVQEEQGLSLRRFGTVETIVEVAIIGEVIVDEEILLLGVA
jgi:hypothetical protein